MEIITAPISHGHWNNKAFRNVKPRPVAAIHSISLAVVIPTLKTVCSCAYRQKNNRTTSQDVFQGRVSEILWFNSCWNCPGLKVFPPFHFMLVLTDLPINGMLLEIQAPSLTRHHHPVVLHHQSVHLLRSLSKRSTLFFSLSSISKKKEKIPCLFWIWGFFRKPSS